MLIGGLQKLTLIDFPGKIAATVFTIGCNFRCPYCYNSELVDPQKIKNHPCLSGTGFFSFLKQRRNFLEGVCISGGEPTIHPGLVEWAKKIKALGYLVKLDTNGSNPEMLDKLIQKKLIDYFAMDIKGPLEKYKKIIGFDNIENIKKSVQLIQNSGIDYEFRTTAVPAILQKEDFRKMAHWLQGSQRYFIQQFRPEKTLDSRFEKEKNFSEEELGEILNNLKSFFKVCKIRP